MKATRLTVRYSGEHLPRSYAIYENGAGEIDICEIGRPRVDGDRSICVRLGMSRSGDRCDVILSVEKMEL